MRLEDLDPAAYALPDDVVATTLSPALVVHLDRVRDNLRTITDLAGGAQRWRPHVKTTKIPAVWAEVAAAGVRHFKCATTREARLLCGVLRQAGIEGGDVLLAYPLNGPALGVLGAIAREHPETRLSVLCEDPALVPSIPADVGVFVDVNPGMHRTGVPLEDRATITAVARAAGARFRGVHGYDGQFHGVDPGDRRDHVFACYEGLLALLSDLDAAGVAVGELITSGTPSFPHALAFTPFQDLGATTHRISPGTVVYHDTMSAGAIPDVDLVPAAVVLSRVVSHPRDGIATCDAGSKSLAAEAGDPCAFVLGRPDLVPQGPSEEHLPLACTAGDRPARGTVLQLVPRHVCPTINLAEEALLVDGGQVVDVVAVSARAHDLRVGS